MVTLLVALHRSGFVCLSQLEGLWVGRGVGGWTLLPLAIVCFLLKYSQGKFRTRQKAPIALRSGSQSLQSGWSEGFLITYQSPCGPLKHVSGFGFFGWGFFAPVP